MVLPNGETLESGDGNDGGALLYQVGISESTKY